MRSRWPILMLLCVLASLLVPGIASANAASGAETRVGAFDLQGQARVGVERSLTLELHPGCEPTYDQLASDSLLAARGGINASQRGLAHVLERHVAGGARTAGKSIFNLGEDIAGLIRGAESVAPVHQVGGNFQRIVDAGRAIGIDRGTGQPTSVYTVITNAAGELVTAFPGIP